MLGWLFNKDEMRAGNKYMCILTSIALTQLIVILISLITTSIAMPLIIAAIISVVVSCGKVFMCDKILGAGVCDIRNFYASLIGVGYGLIISLILLLI